MLVIRGRALCLCRAASAFAEPRSGLSFNLGLPLRFEYLPRNASNLADLWTTPVFAARIINRPRIILYMT